MNEEITPDSPPADANQPRWLKNVPEHETVIPYWLDREMALIYNAGYTNWAHTQYKFKALHYRPLCHQFAHHTICCVTINSPKCNFSKGIWGCNIERVKNILVNHNQFNNHKCSKEIRFKPRALRCFSLNLGAFIYVG